MPLLLTKMKQKKEGKQTNRKARTAGGNVTARGICGATVVGAIAAVYIMGSVPVKRR